MNTIWHTTSEGVQHFIRLDEKAGKLEYSFEPLSELVGGGHFELLGVPEFEKGYYHTLLLKLFGIDLLEEMIATARTLESLPEKAGKSVRELTKERNMMYYHELEGLRSRRSRSSPGPGDS